MIPTSSFKTHTKMKKETLDATAFNPNLFSGKSIEEVALLIRDGGSKKGKKNGRIRRFLGRLFRWLDTRSRAFATTLFITSLLAYFWIIFSFDALGVFIVVLVAVVSAIFAVGNNRVTSLVASCISFFLLLVLLFFYSGLLGWIALGGVLASSLILGVILARQEKKTGQSLLVSKISSDEVVRILTEYVNDFISRNRELIVGSDTEYGRHTADLKRRSAKIQSSINYWEDRGRMEGVSPEYVERRLSLLRDLREKVDVELAQFETDSQETLLKLSALERQVPILKSEVNDHYQDLLIAEHEESLGILAEESRRITMDHIALMRSELLVAEQAISALRLKAIPTLEGEGITGELNARAEAVVNDISSELVVVGA